jgi:hypothetical protein
MTKFRNHDIARVAICAVAALTAAGCVTYSAQLDRRLQRGGALVTVDSAIAKRNDQSRVVLTVGGVPEGVKLLEASLSAEDDFPCSSQAIADAIGRSSGRGAKEALVAGERISLGFPKGTFGFLTQNMSRLDLLVETPKGAQRCIPIPLREGEAEIEWQARERWTLGLDISLEGFTDRIGSVTQFLTFPFTVGYWLDSTHLEIGGGIASSGCPDSSCEPESEDMRINYTTSYLLLAGLDRPFFETGEFSLGGGFRYRVMYMAADTFGGYESYWMHGPVLTPYIGAVPPIPKGSRGIGGARQALVGLEIPIGLAFSQDEELCLTLGANLRMRFTFF